MTDLVVEADDHLERMEDLIKPNPDKAERKSGEGHLRRTTAGRIDV